MPKVLLIVASLVVADHATIPCSKIKALIAMLGRTYMITSAKNHGYTDAQIDEIIRRCKVAKT